MFDLDAKFNETIAALQKGERPRYQYQVEEVRHLIQKWEENFHRPNELAKVICLVDHTYGDHGEWEEVIIKTLTEHPDNQILIHTLGITHRQVIGRRYRLGERLPYSFLKSFEGLLETQDAELLEWTLRTIEQMGSQSIMLKEKVLKRKPGILRVFNQHLKNGHEIIEMLEKRWTIPL